MFANSLTSGRQVSCGCNKREKLIAQCTRHGQSDSDEYRIWGGMLGRCRNPRDDAYRLYGARGIDVKYASFIEFFNDVGPRPTLDHSIDRIDSDGHYEPGNCRWATGVEQANNTNRNRTLSFNGKCRTVAEWARVQGIPYATLMGRIQRGWSVEAALTEPVGAHEERNLTVDGRTMKVAEWAREIGVSEWTLYRRLQRGWSAERTIKEKVRGNACSSQT